MTISQLGVTRLVTLPSYVCVAVLAVWRRVYICIFCLLCMSVFLSIKVYIFAVFSERELKFMFAICHRPSVCLSVVCRLSVVCLSVCNVRAPYSGD